LQQEGVIGELSRQACSFEEACSQKRLLKRSGPQMIELFKQQCINAALLVRV
jgi:hypothetical protein